jgi:hypothetical protein
MVTTVPASPIVGENPVIVGAAEAASTVNGSDVIAEPVGVVTLMGPLVAPAGTLVTSCVDDAAVTVAAVPLNVTAFSLETALNPIPQIVTVLLAGPESGEKWRIATDEEGRVIERRFPTAS